jgi:hypothetical protein
MRHDGGLLIALGAGLGLLVSIYNFLAPAALLAPTSGIAWTPGAGLAVAATAILFVAGLVLGGSASNRVLVGFLIIGSLLGILGTGLAAWLLESPILLALMLMCLLGWLLRVLTRHSLS